MSVVKSKRPRGKQVAAKPATKKRAAKPATAALNQSAGVKRAKQPKRGKNGAPAKKAARKTVPLKTASRAAPAKIAAAAKGDRNHRAGDGYAAYEVFDRADWAELRSNTPLTLAEDDLIALRGVNEQVSLIDVEQIYLPLSRLLNLHFRSARNLDGVRDDFLGRLAGTRPYIIAVAGSVAVGKSTFARVLQALLSRWPDHPQVSLITTDGFLYPNALLEERDLMRRKGFPESYDRRRMIQFLAALKAGENGVKAPIYSHEAYDIMPAESVEVGLPDVLIFEGLNVLQTAPAESSMARSAATDAAAPSVVISDFFDFSIYVDANERHIETWYVNRFLKLQQTVFGNPASYFHHYKDLTERQATETARSIWRDINLPNLHENILPTRARANVVLRKRADHSVDEVWLRKV